MYCKTCKYWGVDINATYKSDDFGRHSIGHKFCQKLSEMNLLSPYKNDYGKFMILNCSDPEDYPYLSAPLVYTNGTFYCNLWEHIK